MKVFLYMESTLNGLISGINDDTSWVSPAAWKSYQTNMSKMDVIIIGKNTYDLMPDEEFNQNSQYLVITHNPTKESKVQNVSFSNHNPKQIIHDLSQNNYQTVCIAGGSNINSAFMKEGLIDELLIDVEPIILGKGLGLFHEADFEFKLKLIETKKLSQNTIQLHYKVLKKS